MAERKYVYVVVEDSYAGGGERSRTPERVFHDRRKAEKYAEKKNVWAEDNTYGTMFDVMSVELDAD